jgi:oligopeptide/dipeptide ABC transporter ATP-binding protein
MKLDPVSGANARHANRMVHPDGGEGRLPALMNAADGPLVRADRLSRRYQTRKLFGGGAGVEAVTDLSLSLRRGEAVGLVGESGSGKSTIGRLLLGLLQPSEGRVFYDGVDLAQAVGGRLSQLRRRMQLVFQDPYASLDPRRRVGAQIADGLAIHALVPRAERRARVETLLGQVGLTPAHADRFPHEFSGGQRQRVGLARALATGPEFLVADEPVSALDVSVQAQVLQLLAKLRSELGLSLLFISHDLQVVRSLCDRVLVLYLGRVMEEGPAADVLEAPHHPYTRALLSAAPLLDPSRRRTRIVLRGDPPSPADPPSGCVFRTRCPDAVAACAEAVPVPRSVGPHHTAACIRVGDQGLRPFAAS